MPASIAAVNETNGSAAATNKVCNLPANIAAGQLLILELRSAGADTHSTPSGWDVVFLNNAADASDDTASCWRRVANGAEGGSVTVNGTASLKFTSVSCRIIDHDPANPPELAGPATGASTTPDPPAITPAGGTKDYLILAFASYAGESTDPPTFPANYTLGQVAASSGTGGLPATNCRSAMAGRQITGSTEDPGTYTQSTSTEWTAWTIAIYPMPPLSWQPEYPDLIAHRVLPVAAMPAFFSPVMAIPNPPVPPVSAWKPDYPHYLAPVIRLADYQDLGARAPPLVEAPPAPPELSWLPMYPHLRDAPDVVLAGSPTAPEESATAPDAATSPQGIVWFEGMFPYAALTGAVSPVLVPAAETPPLAWLPSYPDLVPASSRTIALSYIIEPELPQPAAPAPPLTWAPEFPSLISVPGTVLAGQPLGPAERPGAPLMVWQPEYPDFAPGHAWRPETVTVAPVAPQPNPPAPQLAWLPSYPDRVPAAMRVVGLGQLVEPELTQPAPSAPTLSWLPSYPDRIAGAASRAPETVIVAPTLPPAPAPELSWLPRFPDVVRAPARAPALGGLVEPELPQANPFVIGDVVIATVTFLGPQRAVASLQPRRSVEKL